jgi:hypothetical protein
MGEWGDRGMGEWENRGMGQFQLKSQNPKTPKP